MPSTRPQNAEDLGKKRPLFAEEKLLIHNPEPGLAPSVPPFSHLM